ncbi:hypothetical protein M413DRAFT_32360 [Hebeloma cylindrosporum]|uniref:F-box domain-containing protein n=1 Tax=Hebeloma cylindrosporum TaxID=76867 RepID=A0A0C3BU63_HEBCY|nr:hypothetical protein M413DRAFT_32360 [Hebeloma cylindrosporum h7]
MPQLVTDWLERSGSLPLTLEVSYQGNIETPTEASTSIIETLNKHSGRWWKVRFALLQDYLESLCGSSPPNLLRDLSISDEGYEHEVCLKFGMNSPVKFSLENFGLWNVDISLDNLVELDLCRTTIDGVLKFIRDAPYWKDRSACSLKALILLGGAGGIEDLERLSQAMPSLQHLEINRTYDASSTPVVDYVLERLSGSPPHPALWTGTTGFLPGLQSLKFEAHELNAWACYPVIFRLPHRKLLELDINMNLFGPCDAVLRDLVELVDQESKLSIRSNRQDCLQRFRGYAAAWPGLP